MAELNEPQADAVAHVAGPLLVFAGAGSGKTRTITYRIANLVAQHGVPPYRILAVTFTNKAAGEMKSRLEQLAGDAALDLWVGTFHSVCARLLRRYHAEVGLGSKFVIYDETDQKAVINRIIKDLDLDDREYPPKPVLNRIHAQKREGRGPGDARLTGSFDETLVDLYERYQAALATANAVDFEDLILHVMRIAEDPRSAAGEELRGRFDYVLVDEFQDTNAIQYRLVRALSARSRNLCVVGDDDQSIYRWRGANVALIRGFRRDFPDAQVVKLEQNYRSTSNIVAAALAVIEPALEREPKKLWTAQEAGALVRVRAVQNEHEEAAFVVRAVKDEIARGVDPRNIAVFYRVHAQSRVLEESFRNENVPYQIVGGTKFFERAEVKDLLAYLRLVENPRSDADLMRIINVPTRGIGNKTVARLLDVARQRGTSAFDAIDATVEGGGLGTAAKKKLRAFQKLVLGLGKEALELGPRQLGERVLEESGYRSALRDADTAEADARLENLEELLGSLSEYEDEAHEAGESPTLGGYLERVSLVTAIDSLDDVPSVAMMTVHAAKGLEFDAVFLTGMEEEIFPYRGLRSDEPEELDEERRLAYVAITRARERLVVTHAGTRTLFGRTRYQSKSRFLHDLPDEVTKKEGSAWDHKPAWSPSAVTRGVPRAVLEPGQRVVDADAFDDIPADEPGVEVRKGSRVFHRRFGKGVVESIETGAQPTVVAHFPGFGTRRIRAEYLEFQ